MARKGIDRAGLLGRTDKYYATDISGLFNALIFINNALIEADSALAEANLSADGICPIGYSSLESDITDSENKLATLMTVPDQIVKGLIDTVDAEYESELSSGACSNIQNVRIDNITMRGDKYNPMLPTEKIEIFRKKITKREEALGVTEEVLRARWGDLIPENIRERADAFPCPYRKYELWIAYDACKTEADVRFLTGLLSKDYITAFNTDPGTLTEGMSRVLGTFARTLLPADMYEKEIETSELEKFNNVILENQRFTSCVFRCHCYEDALYRDIYLDAIVEACEEKRKEADILCNYTYFARNYDKVESDYFAYTELRNLFRMERTRINEILAIQSGLCNGTRISNIKMNPYSQMTADFSYYSLNEGCVNETLSSECLVYSEKELEKLLAARGLSREEYTCAALDLFMYIDMFDDSDDEYEVHYAPADFINRIKLKYDTGTLTIFDVMKELDKEERYANRVNDNSNTDNKHRAINYTVFLEAMRKYPNLRDLNIKKASRLETFESDKESYDYNSGTNGIFFYDKNKNEAYVAYRGTSKDEWMDDAKRMHCQSSERDVWTLQMKQAVDFFDSIHNDMKDMNVYITGHSQGGNDAQTVALLSDFSDVINNCYSFDGEGFSEELVIDLINKKGKAHVDNLISKMNSISGTQDPVHRLGYIVIPNDKTKYIDIQFDLTDPTRCHDIVSMFAGRDMSGKIEYTGMINTSLDANGEKIEKGAFSDVLRLCMNYIELYPEDTETGAEIYIMDQIQRGLSHGKVTQGIDGTVVTEEDEKTLNKMMKNLIEVIRPKGPSFDTAYNIYNQVKLYKSLTEGR